MSPVRLDAHDREHDGAVGHAEALHPRPGRDVIAPEPHGAGEIRDADATRVEERQILAALPRPDEDVGKTGRRKRARGERGVAVRRRTAEAECETAKTHHDQPAHHGSG